MNKMNPGKWMERWRKRAEETGNVKSIDSKIVIEDKIK